MIEYRNKYVFLKKKWNVYSRKIFYPYFFFLTLNLLLLQLILDWTNFNYSIRNRQDNCTEITIRFWFSSIIRVL